MNDDDGFESVAEVGDLPDGTPVAVQLSSGQSVCLIRVGSDVFACEDRCSHAEFPMSDGEMVDEFVIECSLHGAQFDVRTGEVLESPATEGLRMYEVRVLNDEVLLKVGAEPS